MTLSAEQLQAFARDGYLIVPDVFPAARMHAALVAMERLFYGDSFAQHRERHAQGAPIESVPDGIAPMPSGRRTRWPVGDDALDRLIECEPLLAACRELLGGEPFYLAATLFLRCGAGDTRHPADAHSGWHFDHPNNTLLPPSPQAREHHYLNIAVYLHDVGPAKAPTLLVPGSHHHAAAWLRTHAAAGNFDDGTFRDVRRVVQDREPIAAVAAAGSVLFYSSLLLHAAQPFADRDSQRAWWTLAVGRRDHAAWCRQVNPFGHGEREYTKLALARTTTAVRTLLGWPPPGDPYYTPATLELLAQLYPGIDLTSCRAALDKP